MTVREYIEKIERSLRDPVTKELPLPPAELIDVLSDEVAVLSGEFDWDWAGSPIRPAIRTKTGERTYSLPGNFGFNFARGGDTSGEIFTVTLDNSTSETPLQYLSTARFYSKDLVGESNGTPTTYTITTDYTSGGKQMVLSPPPDANGDTGYYQVNGLYVPTDWKFEDSDYLLPVPANSNLLLHRVLAEVYRPRDDRLHRFHVAASNRALSKLILAQARGRSHRVAPKLSRRNSNRNSNSLIRGK